MHAKLRASEDTSRRPPQGCSCRESHTHVAFAESCFYIQARVSYLTCPLARVASQSTVKSDQVSPVKHTPTPVTASLLQAMVLRTGQAPGIGLRHLVKSKRVWSFSLPWCYRMTLGDGHYCDSFFSSASKLKTPVEGGTNPAW